MRKPLTFFRPGPEGIELCIVTYDADGAAKITTSSISPERAVVLGNELITLGLQLIPTSQSLIESLARKEPHNV